MRSGILGYSVSGFRYRVEGLGIVGGATRVF